MSLPPENDNGNVEYKWRLTKLNTWKRNKLISQMRWRVLETVDDQSALYILGVYDNGELSGLPRDDLIITWLNLMDCATMLGLYTCLRHLGTLGSTNTYWAIMQIFRHPTPKRDIKFDHDIPNPPNHIIPDYIEKII